MAAAVSPVFLFDERGQEWVVYPDDPPWPFIRALWMRGVREMVLPRKTILGQGLTSVTLPATMAQWDISKPAIAELFRRLSRLQDCIKYLTEHPPGDN